jgi:ABC-type multidrug transport system ATPase subunit
MPRGEIRGVTKWYGRHTAVCDVSLAVDAGEIVGLIGPNGAGKTTLLRLFAGLIRPTRGAVHIPTADRPAIVRYFAGEHSLPPDVTSNRWLALWSAPAIVNGAGRKITGTLGTLSRGTRQRVGLEAMLADPDVTLLLLDEPWEGLDPDASRWLSEQLLKRRAAGAGVIVSSHRIHDLADVCDRCVFLVDGRLSAESLAVAAWDGVGDRSARLFTAFDRARGQR